MICFLHNAVNAAAICAHCGGGMCSNCVINSGTPACADCLVAKMRAERLDAVGELFAATAIFGVSTWLVHSLGSHELTLGNAAMIGVLLVCTYFGWIYLAKLFRDTIIVSSVFWLFLTMVKLVVAYPIGLVFGPIKIIGNVRKIILATRYAHSVRSKVANGEVPM